MSMSEDFVRYNRRVRYLTECTLKENGITVDNRFCYNIDHIFPIKRGYDLGIPEHLIASLDNLQIMDWKLNRKKGSHITEIPENILEFMVEHDVFV